MTYLVIADAHLGQGRGDLDAMTSLVECATAAGITEIVYLGDVCQYLIGMSKFWSTVVCRTLDAWRHARRAGVRVVLIEGNRDFFLDEADLAGEIDHSARVYDIRSGDTLVRFDHGDLVNRRDWQYRFWSTISKSAPARLWARILPRRLAISIVRRMESRLADTNRRFRYVKPVDDLERSARAAWADGIDLLLWGHFHTPWWTSLDDRLALVVPSWLEFRLALIVGADGPPTWVDQCLTPVGTVSTMNPCPPTKSP